MSIQANQPEPGHRAGGIGILLPGAAGSVGDQAMLDSAADMIVNGFGRKVLVGPNVTPIRIPADMPKGTGKGAAIPIMARMLLTCRSTGFIGADVMDGVYGAGPVMKRLRFLSAARRLGQKTRIFGCSWSETPSETVIAALRNSPWLELYARDPISQGRMEKAIGREVRLVADLAFLLKPALTTAAATAAQIWLRDQRRQGRTVMGVNLSGHTIRTLPGDGVQTLSAPIRRWLEADANRSILLMPHDRRTDNNGDGAPLERLRVLLSDHFADRIHAMPTELQAWDLKALAGEVDLVLTGRMHLAIAAMGMGTPALCTVYQGKFEGLMAHFGLEGMTVSPDGMDDAAFDAQLARATEHRNTLRGQIQDRLPTILELSRRNFSGL